MPALRSRPQTMSASGGPETVVRTTPSPGSTGAGYWLQLVAGRGEMHVVLRRARPGAAPPPADRAEGAHDRRRHHPAPDLRAVEVRNAGALPRPAAARVRIFDRVQIDREAEGVLRPAARAASTR